MAVIEVRDVRFAYADRPVVDGVSLAVEAGEFLGLVGPNGSGKTTLLELMIGLRQPDSGSVSLFGAPAASATHGDRVGYVPQDVANAKNEMPITVREAVRMGRYPQKLVGRFSETDRTAVEEALERVEITDLADRRVGRLSGGQRQRVFIARALAADADLLALDEPTVGVDAESRGAFYDLLNELNEDGMTIVLIEHDIGVVTTHASKIACLNRELFFHGDPETFAETDALGDAYGDAQSILQHNH
ncbi:zinc transport system ATP-binding protein [Halovenus aranensis]|jgi:zinc transport system ATP-binding protein|uniref:Cobalamin import ATP-binding protein BtuD n=1 Tax=Halovenus aranensis TaxID=890420 RepID=A0A1G8TL20_9EURY|nr:metal ABC transporter ATP-binding protein [Halovenus aranensis]SDJ42276.1 zinc transport system ATP-binding protein [Halovenus aranensis]